jgi:hypothetical protein
MSSARGAARVAVLIIADFLKKLVFWRYLTWILFYFKIDLF